tara:strand:+ start:3243 stop:3896 length:654 start_codon:yes stop_codon:yes gene_type:complete
MVDILRNDIILKNYDHNISIKDVLTDKTKTRIAHFCDGPVSGYNHHFNNSFIFSNKLKDLGYVLIDNFNDFFNLLQNDNHVGVLGYCGHGLQTQSNTESDGTSEQCMLNDIQLTNLVNSINNNSRLIVILDCCYSDGMINSIPSNVSVFSAAREHGPDEYRYAHYTGDGGFMSWNFYNISLQHARCNKKLNDLLGKYHIDIEELAKPRCLGNDKLCF